MAFIEKHKDYIYNIINNSLSFGIIIYNQNFDIVEYNDNILKYNNFKEKKIFDYSNDLDLNTAIVNSIDLKKETILILENIFSFNKISVYIIPIVFDDFIGGMLLLDIKNNVNYNEDVFNKDKILENLSKRIEVYKKEKNISAFLFFDIDNFKNINDSLGHSVGDNLLDEIIYRLRKIFRKEDILARWSGDDFVIILSSLSKDKNEAKKLCDIVAEKIHKEIQKPFIINDNALKISVSIGIEIIDNENNDEAELLKHAEIAMYRSKKIGKGQTSYYYPEMGEWLKRKVVLENAMYEDIQSNYFYLLYQPVVDISTNKVIGAEALVRWGSPKLGNVFPDEFISIAEETGLIVPLGRYIMKKACHQFKNWKNKYHIDNFVKISINVSPQQFIQKDFINDVINVIEENGINPNHIYLELTESIIINDIQETIDKMNTLRGMGINISMDDFGTGYSSLSYLKKLPFNILKIDKSFVNDIAEDTTLIRTMLSIAKDFNMKVVAEGVETFNQLQFLKDNDCEYFQGYYFSKPIEPKIFEEKCLNI